MTRRRWASRHFIANSIIIMAISGVALALNACGGGGGGSGSGDGGGSGVGSGPSPISGVSGLSISESAATNEGAPRLSPAVTFNLSTPGTYYYQLSYAGTAIGLAPDAIGLSANSITYNTGNSTLGSAPELAYAIGATLYGSSSGNLTINWLYFLDPAMMGAGVYHDSLTLRVCLDAGCTQQIAGSPITVPVTYTVTGSAIPAAQITVYPDVQVELPGSQTTTGTGSVIIGGGSLPPTGAFVTMGQSAGGIVTQTAFTSTLAPNSLDIAQGAVNFTLRSPSSIGAGIHTDTFPINVCFDTACTKPAAGSPWTAQVTYIVDPVAGSDYTQSTLNVPVSGLVWDGTTNKLYAIIPAYSTLDPNTVAQIDPYSGTIDTAVSLDGGVGNIVPGTLAVSDDGQYLYVAVSDAAGLTDHVERLLTGDLGLDLSITLPAQQTVAELQPAPAEPHTLAVEIGGSAPEVVIYDDATARSNALTSASGTTLQSFTWGADASTLYATLWGSPTGTAVGSVEAATASPTGLAVSQSLAYQAPTSQAVMGPMHFVEGLLCWEGGQSLIPRPSRS